MPHPKQLTFSWTTEKKEESSRSPKTLPNYDCVCTYACIFSNKPRKTSPRVVFLRHYSRSPLQTHTHTSSIFLLPHCWNCYHPVNDRSTRSMISHSASGRLGFWDGSSMSQLATLIRAATHYPPSMSQLATTIRAATHILETQLTVTS